MKKVILLSLFCLVFFAFSAEAKVCKLGVKCAVPKLPEAVSYSKAVFSGKVINVEKDGDTKIFTIQVGNYWKGPVKRKVKVYILETMRYQACFELGKSYLFYARENNKGQLSDGRCSLTKRMEDAKKDLKYLGKGKRPK